MADPTPDDFYVRRRPGESPLRAFIDGLPMNQPVRLPDGLSRAATPQGRQSTVSNAARQNKMVVRTMIRDGEVWVMRIA